MPDASPLVDYPVGPGFMDTASKSTGYVADIFIDKQVDLNSGGSVVCENNGT